MTRRHVQERRGHERAHRAGKPVLTLRELTERRGQHDDDVLVDRLGAERDRHGRMHTEERARLVAASHGERLTRLSRDGAEPCDRDQRGRSRLDAAIEGGAKRGHGARRGAREAREERAGLDLDRRLAVRQERQEITEDRLDREVALRGPVAIARAEPGLVLCAWLARPSFSPPRGVDADDLRLPRVRIDRARKRSVG
jgi:hypothetical protein